MVNALPVIGGLAIFDLQLTPTLKWSQQQSLNVYAHIFLDTAWFEYYPTSG